MSPSWRYNKKGACGGEQRMPVKVWVWPRTGDTAGGRRAAASSGYLSRRSAAPLIYEWRRRDNILEWKHGHPLSRRC